MLSVFVSAIDHEGNIGLMQNSNVSTATYMFACYTGASEIDVGSNHEYIAHFNACPGARGCGEQQHEQ